MRARLCLLFLSLVALAASSAPPALATAAAPPRAVAAALPPGPTGIQARAAIVVDPHSGVVLWGRRSGEARPPASLTKMMTALLVRASLPLGAVAVTDRQAARTPPSKLALKPGQRITVGQALQALMIVSANDMAVLLADRSAGSVRRFQQAMNAASRRLGLRRSSWRSTNGLDARGHRSSAFDLAILARAVLRDPWLARTVRTRKVAFRSPGGHRHELYAHSRFLREYPGAVGIKTGYTEDAGHCLAAAATRKGRNLVAIVLDSPDPAHAAGRLMDWGFGRGRRTDSGLRLPAYTAAPSVKELLAAPATRPTPAPQPGAPGSPGQITGAVVGGAGAAGGGAPGRPVAGLPAAGWLPSGLVMGTAGVGVVLLGGAGLALHRRRRRPGGAGSP